MTWGAEIWGPMLIQAAASAASGYFGGKGEAKKETKIEKTKRKLLDQLLASVDGNGPYSDLFRTDRDAFNTSYVEPAMQTFRDKIAPGIQQQYIAHGQQRGTALDDTLTRAGVDLDNLLNQKWFDYQQGAENRKMNAINTALGMGPGAANSPSGWQNVMTGLGNYTSSQGFSDSIADLFRQYSGNNKNNYSTSGMTRGARGYWSDY